MSMCVINRCIDPRTCMCMDMCADPFFCMRIGPRMGMCIGMCIEMCMSSTSQRTREFKLSVFLTFFRNTTKSEPSEVREVGDATSQRNGTLRADHIGCDMREDMREDMRVDMLLR